MIIWLASYPRSGNTLLRTLLKDSFGLQTYSVYDDQADIGDNPELSDRIGHKLHGLPQEEFVRAAHEDSSPYYVKTHELPSDGSKALYVVRDGRAAVISYQHYLRSFAGVETPLAELILGFDLFVPWSEHVTSWVEGRAGETLLLRYETLVEDPDAAMAEVGRYLGLGKPAPVRASFTEMNALAPNFFRRGSNDANIGEIRAGDENLFWFIHGSAMKRLGYVDEVPPIDSDVLRASLLELRTQRRIQRQERDEWVQLAQSWRRTAEDRLAQLEAAASTVSAAPEA